MRTKRTRDYINILAKKYNLEPKQVLEITESMFRFTAQTMTNSNRKLMWFDEVRLMGWGVFRVKEGRRKYFERYNEKRHGLKSSNRRTKSSDI
jgi:hypothetical protein